MHFDNQSSFKSRPVGKIYIYIYIYIIGIYGTEVIAVPISIFSKKYKSYLEILNGRKSCAKDQSSPENIKSMTTLYDVYPSYH